MPLYCLCEANNDKPDSQAFGAPNRYCAVSAGDDFPPLSLPRQMECIKTGAMQVVLDTPEPNMWTGAGRPASYRRHFPNVDVFECPHCHARIAKE